MSGKLDQSLDDILSTRRRSAGPRRRSQRQAGNNGRPAATAPVGGVQKTSKNARTAVNKPAATKANPHTGDSKIIVSNLPKDVNEQQIKEYFAQAVGSIKKVEVSYGPNSVSRGIANVIFSKPDGASRAFQKLNGLLVDGRPIKIEIVVGASQAAKVIPASKTLAERTTQPKAQPKSAASNKQGNNAKGAGASGRGKKGARGGGRTGRPVKKSAEELDSEMADYFQGGPPANENANAGGAAPAATGNGDAPMEDEIM